MLNTIFWVFTYSQENTPFAFTSVAVAAASHWMMLFHACKQLEKTKSKEHLKHFNPVQGEALSSLAFERLIAHTKMKMTFV